MATRRSEQKSTLRMAGAAPILDPPRDLHAFGFCIGGDEYVLLSFPARGAGADGPPAHCATPLTPAEQSILSMVLRGERTVAIAAARRTSPRTIANQLAAIYEKLGVSSRRELGARARSSSA